MPPPPTRSSRRLAPASPPPQAQPSSGSSSSLASDSSAQSASAILMHPDALPCLKRRQLVSLCGRFGLKASGKNVELVARLQDFARRNVDAAGPTAGCFAVLRPVKPEREGSEEPADAPQRPLTPPVPEMQQGETACEDVEMEDAQQEHSQEQQDVEQESEVSTAPPSPAPAPSPSPTPSPAVRRTRRVTRPTVLPAAPSLPRAAAADVSYPALPSTRAASPVAAAAPPAPEVPGSWQHAISAEDETSLPSLDPLRPSIRAVARMPSDGASDYGSSSISFPGPASPVAPAPQDFAPAPLAGTHKRTTSATSSLLGSLRGLRAKGKVLGDALKGKRKRTNSNDDLLANATPQRRKANDDAEMSFVLVSPAPGPRAAQVTQEDDIGDASTIGATSRRGSTVGASSLRSLFDPPAPSPRSSIAQTAPLRIIKAQPRPSRALQQTRASMQAHPVADSPAASPAASLPTASPVPNPPLPPSASASAFSAAGAAVLAEMNARLVAAGRAPLVSFPDASTWAARRAAAPKMPPLDPHDRFESTHQRGFGSMRSITEHYAARRTARKSGGSAASKAPLRPNARAAAAAAAAKKPQAATGARVVSTGDGEAPAKRSRLQSIPKVRSASAASSAAQVLAAAKARQQAVFGSSAAPPAKNAPASSSTTAAAPARSATLGGRIKGAVRGFVGATGARTASVSKPAPPPKAAATSSSSMPRSTSVRATGSLSQPRPAGVDSSSLGPRRGPNLAASTSTQRTASAASSSASSSGSGSVAKRPVFDLAASLARKPTYKPYSAAEALAGLSAPTTAPSSVAPSRPAVSAASRPGADRERKVRSSLHPTARGSVAGAKRPPPRLSATGKAIVRSARDAQLGRVPPPKSASAAAGGAAGTGLKRTPASTTTLAAAAARGKTLPPLPKMQSQAKASTLPRRTTLAPLRNAAPTPAPAPARPATLSSA